MKKYGFYAFIFFLGTNLYTQDANNAANTTSASNALTGFDGLQWGVDYREAKDRFRTLSSSADAKEPVSIIADTPETEIKVKRNNIVYRYFFYQKPKILVDTQTTSSTNVNADNPQPAQAVTDNKTPIDTNGNQSQDQNKVMSRLFLVESTFSYVPAEDLNKKITEKYGTRNGGILDDKTNRGFYLWNLDRGYIIQWIDPYKKMPFSRSIYYVSKELVEEIKADYPKYQYSKEIQILKDILF
ncbi:MAG: hypothetical protein OEV78_09035 [Spirochaetia bacterium]|nr:hypothetical protein [Spirochaetia bacterium]